MLKVRVMPTLLYKDFGLVKGEGFDSWRRVGSAMQAVKVYNVREVDELVLVDITATLEQRKPDLAMIDELADECFMPLAVGGGITSIEDVRDVLAVGADKVVVNSAALADPGLVTRIADRFGAQCVVASIDYRTHPDGRREVYTHAGTRPTGRALTDVAVELASAGAGELLLTSIERDGTMVGYDTAGIADVSGRVEVPVIASGGAGSYEHMRLAICEGKASAVAAAAIFHFTQQTPLEAKRYLHERGVAVRL